MGLFSFLSGQKQNSVLSLVIDIGSSSVGASLLKIEAGKPIQVLATDREDISFQDRLSSSRFLLSMNHALENTLKKIQAKNEAVPPHIFCTLSSPWFILKIRSLTMPNGESFKVTEKVIDDFFAKDIEQMKRELKNISPKEIEVIEKKIIQVKLDEREVKNPLGKTAQKMEIIASVAFSSKRVIQSVENNVKHFFPVSSLHFDSFPVVTFSAIRDIFPLEQNFLFLDITGETTDISLVVDDLLVRSVSFPRGKNFLIREISSGLNTPHEEAETLFGMFLRGTLDKESRTRVQGIVERGKDEWALSFEKALSAFSEKGSLPGIVFFTGDPDIAEPFARLINVHRSDLIQGGTFEARYLDKFMISKYVSFESGVIRDPFLVIGALFAKKLLTSKQI